MCVVSMVMEHYQPIFPQPEPTPVQPFQPMQTVPFSWPTPQTMAGELQELRVLIGEFRELYEATKKIDVLTKQPDCEDPEKIKLVARVDLLEKRLMELEATRKPTKKRPKKKASKKPRSMLR